MDRQQTGAASWVTISGIIRLIIAFLVMFLVFLSCKKPSEPVFDSVYDEQSERFIPFADLNTSSVTGVRAQSATSGGQFANDYGKPVTQKGVCWSLVQIPTVEGNCSQEGSGLSAFTSTLTSLVTDTLYYVRAYATNADGTTYGQQLSFKTLDGRPVFGQAGVSAVTATSATATATITSDGGESITGRGVCYATTENPTTEDTCMASGTGTGDYSVTLTGLSAETAYYVRAYAFNAIRIIYSEQVSFTTTGIPPTVTTGAVNNITTTGATVAGNVSAEGGSTVTARGVVWSTSQNPTISSNVGITTSGSGIGGFSANLTGLTSGVRYYARAYATNAAATGYGSQIEFTTTGTAPTVTTGAVSNITTSGATVAGNVSAQGSSTVSARGVCYATSENPTTSNTCVSSGSGTGAFSASLTGLTSGVRYYVRAYATNNAGTSYGLQTTFTYILPPTVTTDSVGSITASSATVGGNVTSDGGSTVTERGICYATTQNPTTANTCRASGSGTGAFTVKLNSLSVVTTYYVRAYATNSVGTSYGLQSTFTTLAKLPNVTTNHVSGYYGQNWIYFTGDVTSDGGSTVTERGICFYTNIDPNKCIVLGSGTGSFGYQLFLSTSITWVTFRAYATNSIGTSYGLERWYVFNW